MAVEDLWTKVSTIISKLSIDVLIKFFCYYLVYKTYLYIKSKTWKNPCKPLKQEDETTCDSMTDAEFLKSLLEADGENPSDDLEFFKSLGNKGKEDLKAYLEKLKSLSFGNQGKRDPLDDILKSGVKSDILGDATVINPKDKLDILKSLMNPANSKYDPLMTERLKSFRNRKEKDVKSKSDLEFLKSFRNQTKQQQRPSSSKEPSAGLEKGDDEFVKETEELLELIKGRKGYAASKQLHDMYMEKRKSGSLNTAGK